MKNVRSIIARGYSKAVVVGTSLTAAAGSALAAVPTDVATALADAKTDSLAVAGLGLIIIVGIAAFKYMRRGL